MRRLLRTMSRAIHAAKCPSGCYCVKKGWVWRCDTCGHIC